MEYIGIHYNLAAIICLSIGFVLSLVLYITTKCKFPRVLLPIGLMIITQLEAGYLFGLAGNEIASCLNYAFALTIFILGIIRCGVFSIFRR